MKTFGTITVIGVFLLFYGILFDGRVTGLNMPVGSEDTLEVVCLISGWNLVGLGAIDLFWFRDARKRLPGMQGRRYRENVILSWVVCFVLPFPFWAAVGTHIMIRTFHQGGCDEFYRRMIWHVWPTLVGLFFCLAVGYSLLRMRRDRKFREMVARGEPVCMYCGYSLKGHKGRCPECGKEPFSVGS